MISKGFILSMALTGTIALSFLSCDNIYDDPEPVSIIPTEGNSYRYINATKYTNWVYINLHKKDSVTLDYRNVHDIPAEWDIAIHRYDVKTNGGAGLETAYEALDALQADVGNGVFVRPMASSFVKDAEDDSVTVDMSTMMQGYLGYAPSPVNHEIGKWLHLDLSTMPPIYTPSNKVYLILMSDGTIGAIRFTGYSNPDYYNTKGYISFDYLYPLNFKR